MPTLPDALMSIELVGAPGRMRSGSREPPVTSRTNQLASFAPISHVCAVKPPPLVCSCRMAGVSVAVTWGLRTGALLPKPTLPVLATNRELVGELPVTVKGTVAAVMSSIENFSAPPLALSLAGSCQSCVGKPVDGLGSWDLIRVLFSFRRGGAKPDDSFF